MTDDSTIKLNGIEGFIDRIPALPVVVQTAQNLLNQTVLDVDKLVSVLESDPGMVAKILRVANSSFYGLSREIINLRDACIVLGHYTLRNIIMTTVLVNVMQGRSAKKEKCHQLIEHCINTAIIARILAEKTGQNRDIAYIVGLLHDIGSLYIEVIVPDEAMSIRNKVEHEEWDIEQAEQQCLGFDHAQLSGEVARNWQLPEEIALSLQHHHKVDHNVDSLSNLVYVADYISLNIDLFETEGKIQDAASTAVLERLGLDDRQIFECIQSAKSALAMDLNRIVGK